MVRHAFIIVVALIGFAAPGLLTAEPITASAEADTTCWVRGYGQQYTLNVYLDATTQPDIAVHAVRWALLYPKELNFIEAALPDEANPSTNPDDFFFGATMREDFNFLEDTPIVYSEEFLELRSNFRIMEGEHTGVTDRSGLLGSFVFEVPADMPLGETGLFPISVSVFDDAGAEYMVSYGNLEVEPAMATIHSGILGDMDNNGAANGLDIPLFKEALQDPAAWYDATGIDPSVIADFNGDGSFSGLDIPGFKMGLAGATPTAIPEPATTLLLAGGLAALLRRRALRR